MSRSASAETFESAVAQIDELLAFADREPSLHVDRGQLLEMLGRKDEAVQAYVEALRHEPAHAPALNAMGLLRLAAGDRAAALTLLTDAARNDPANAAAQANLACVLAQDDRLTAARELYDHALRLDPELAVAHHGLAEILPRLGDDEGAARHRFLGLRLQPITIGRYSGEGSPICVLVLGTAAIGNVPTSGYFDEGTFLLASVAVDHLDDDAPLPPHDVVFNAIGEADLCALALAKAAAIVNRTDAAVINDPHAVAATSRAANSQRLRRLDGVRAPRIAAFPRAQLTSSSGQALLAKSGFTYPLLVRSPGYHTGDHFRKVDHAAELEPAVAALPGDELLVIEYLDLRDTRGDLRKYRVMIVDGELYPLHLAISRAWKVHYFSADMAERPEHRAQDAAFLADMPAVLGARAHNSLLRVRDTLALDFGGIDFAIDAAGDVVVFEANASMIVPAPGSEAIWDYRREPVSRIRDAVRAMLLTRAALPR